MLVVLASCSISHNTYNHHHTLKVKYVFKITYNYYMSLIVKSDINLYRSQNGRVFVCAPQEPGSVARTGGKALSCSSVNYTSSKE